MGPKLRAARNVSNPMSTTSAADHPQCTPMCRDQPLCSRVLVSAAPSSSSTIDLAATWAGRERCSQICVLLGEVVTSREPCLSHRMMPAPFVQVPQRYRRMALES